MKKFTKHLLAGFTGAVLSVLMSVSTFAAVSVKIVGDDDHPLHQHTEYKTWLEASYDIPENSGTLTADKAIFSVLEKAGFTYTFYEESGYLANITTPQKVTLPGTENLIYGGWMYKVNGDMPYVGIAQYEIKDNDEIEVFYLDDYRELYGYNVNINVTPADALVHIYDKDKNEMFDSGWGYSLPKGSYTYTVEKTGYKTAEGSFDITLDDGEINAVLEKKTDVAVVRIIGDEVHKEGEHQNYKEWYSEEFVPAEGSNAEDAVIAALKKVGCEVVYNDQYGYISGVTMQDSTVLGEFTNGKNSGWIYTVDGISPVVALRDYKIQAGEEIVFKYYDDYRELYGYTVNINTNFPAAVTVSSADGEIAENPWGGYSLVSGIYYYKVEKEGFKTVEESFEVTNDDVAINVVLEPDFIWGDYNLDGELKADDAAKILQKTLLSTYPAPFEDSTYINVDMKEDITANDAATVLTKVLNSAFVMPCEETAA